MPGTSPWVPDDAVEHACSKCGAGPRVDCMRPDGSPAPRFHHVRLAAAQTAFRRRREPVAVTPGDALLCEQPLRDGRQCRYFAAVPTPTGKRICGHHARYINAEEAPVHG